ncbi:MAG: c-type cytochrome [Burkholderiales bacterium]
MNMYRLWIASAACGLALACGGAQADSVTAVDKAKQVCAACHGEDGNKPNTPDTPKLGGQPADYLAKALRDYQSGARKNPIMGAMSAGLSKREILDMAAYFAGQKSELRVKY